MDWKSLKSRRGFFENFAIANEFNPLIPHNWYQQSLVKIKASPVTPSPLYYLSLSSSFSSFLYVFIYPFHQNAHEVISYHGFNVSRALMELFPNIGLEKSKLLPKCIPLTYPSLSLPLPLCPSPSPQLLLTVSLL